MKQYTKDNEIKYANRIVVIKDGMQVINPTEEQILADGWVEYVAPEPEPAQPRLEPSSFEVQNAVSLMMLPQVRAAFVELDDQEALKVKELAPTWASKIGSQVETGDRLWYNDYLIKVRMQHTVQEDWKPSKDTSSLYEQIFEDHAGTAEDPIPYNVGLDPDFLGMTLEMGKIYTQKGALYECIEGTGIPVYDDLDNPALARYVKAVE